MKYWFYSEGNILGPYEPAEMLALPAFAEESLVCPETSTGDNPGDWRTAAQTGEIASALSMGSGRTITANAVAGAYEYGTGFNSSAVYFEDKGPSSGASYGELLDTIDNILGAYKEGPSAPGRTAPETNYDLAEKFDVRLSHIQEELEAARWEKNLLLEKIRTKEQEEKKNRERIAELEARLKNELGKSYVTAREFEQLRHLADLKERAETVRQIEEIKREERALEQEMPPARFPAPAAQTPSAAAAQDAGAKVPRPEPLSELPGQQAAPSGEAGGPLPIEVKSLKSMTRGSEIKLETSLGRELKEEAEDQELDSRKFKSLGQTQPPAYVYGSHDVKQQPAPEAAPQEAFKAPEIREPLPQQSGGLVYDFTVVTPKEAGSSQQFQIETRSEGVSSQTQTQAREEKPAPAVPEVQKPEPAQSKPAGPVTYQTAQVQHGFQFQAQPQPEPEPVQLKMKPVPDAPEPQSFSPSAPLAPAAVTVPPAKAPAFPPESPDKTQRISLPQGKVKPEVKLQEKPRKKGGRMAFIAILVIFGSIAAGGLGYFFMGEGVSFSEFSMLSLGEKKKPVTMGSQLEAKTEQAPAAQPVQAARPQPSPTEKPASENIKKALDIVKGYKLSGGRGTVATWFANSFLSGNSGGASEEWTATPLHGDILVVQYRLLRPRQEPLIYQFEVDSAKRDIVRGINNSAIELLDFSSKEKSVSAAPVKKPAAKAPRGAKARKTAKPGQIPILPLPDAPAGAQQEQDPTGFENAQAEGSEQVKYLKAQESDEELF